MKRGLLWKGVIIGLVVLVGALSAYPLGEKISLGLDLRGGTYLVLQVETEDALRAETDKDLARLVQELQDKGLETASGTRTSSTAFDILGVGADRAADVSTEAAEFLPGWDYQRRDDAVAFEMKAQNANLIANQSVKQALETIRNRVDAFGVSEPVIQRQGLEGNRIVVQLPGVDDPERVKKLIKNTAFLDFRLVAYPPDGRGAPSREEILGNYGGRLPDDVEIVSGPIRDSEGNVVAEQYYAVEKVSVITGRDLKDARPGLGDFNQPIVNFFLTHEGGQRFGDVTGANIGRGLAIVLDGKVRSAPTIRAQIRDSGIIEGSFTRQEVEDLSTVLKSGALPAAITYLEERTVGPSLGQDSIDQGLKAGLLGMALVVLTMFLVYKLSGVNAVVALAMNIVLIFGALAYFGATLTLPGIAGIALTIGMAVDANVLVFERIREELRHGRTVKSAIDAGFGKALSSVLDANITTLLAALFLFQFGTGPIRGFAVTLSIGIFASLFSAIFVSRWLFDMILSRRRRVDRLSI
ncbi:MAG: protein translocase subunit SecD [bacterium]|nr:protein translocase subunit SecD [bacterium]